MPVIPDTIAENAFMDEYKPVELERGADVMMQTFDEALALASVAVASRMSGPLLKVTRVIPCMHLQASIM